MNFREIALRVLRGLDYRLVKPEDRMKTVSPPSSTIPDSLMSAYTQDGAIPVLY